MKEFVEITLGESPYTFRALDLDQLEQLEPQFLAAASASNSTLAAMPKEALQAVAEIAAASLKHKHPDITVAACRKLITLATITTVMDAVRGVSGIAAPGEG